MFLPERLQTTVRYNCTFKMGNYTMIIWAVQN